MTSFDPDRAIGLADIFHAQERTAEKLQTLAEKVAQQTGAMEAIVQRQGLKEAEHAAIREQIGKLKENQDKADALQRLADHDARISRIERYRYAVPLSSILAIASAVGAIYVSAKGG